LISTMVFVDFQEPIISFLVATGGSTFVVCAVLSFLQAAKLMCSRNKIIIASLNFFIRMVF
jgi:hypothetical protein